MACKVSFIKERSFFVEKSVRDIVKSFFRNGHMLKELHKTYIVLISIVENPERVSHYRLSVFAMCLIESYRKTMTNRLKMVLNKDNPSLYSTFDKE